MNESARSLQPCRIALLGCGAVSELYHAPALQHLEAKGSVHVTAVFDPDASRAAKLRELFPQAIYYPDESFLEKIPLDLALIASPVSSHEAHTTRALAAGLAVLCEKPLASDIAAGERMIAAATKHRRILAVGLLRRFYSNVQLTRQIIANKTLGAVTSFSIREGGPFNWPARSDSLFRKQTAGGGVLLDIGVHVLDLVINWFGEPSALNYADDAMGGLEANCRLDLTYTAGFQGTISLSRDWTTANLYIIEFENGTIKLRAGHGDTIDLQIHHSSLSVEGIVKNRPASAHIGGSIATAAHFQEAFLAQWQNVIHAVQTGQQVAVPAQEAIRSLRLIEQCYRTRKLMDMPWLTAPEVTAGRALAAGGAV